MRKSEAFSKTGSKRNRDSQPIVFWGGIAMSCNPGVGRIGKFLFAPLAILMLLATVGTDAKAAEATATYEYDELGRLRSATMLSEESRAVIYDYDAAGNRTAVSTMTPPAAPVTITVPASSTTGDYTISWSASPGEVTAYELYEATNASFTAESKVYSGASTSVAFTGKGNGTYYYRARACNGAVCGHYRAGDNATTVALPASMSPSISVPASSNTGSYTISWGASAGNVTAYQLYEAANASFTNEVQVYNGSALNTALSGKGNGAYYYRVRACNGGACSGYRTGANATTVTLPPGTPASITVPASTITTGSYSISWGASTGSVTAYELYEATNAAFTGQTQIYTGISTSAAISGKSDGMYYYRVRACNGSECSSYRTGDHPAVVTLAPGVPSSISVPSSDTTGSYTIGWGGATGTVTAYQLYEATNASFTGQVQVYSGTALNGSVSGRSNGTYYYRVRACNSGVCGDYRTSANTTVVTLAPGVPSSISIPSSSTTGSYTVSWGSSTGTITAFELYEATNASFTAQVQIYSGAATSSALSGKANGTYYYRARACNGPACSGYRTGANAAAVTLPPSVPPSITIPTTSTTGNYTVSWGASSGAVTAYELYETPVFASEALVYSGAGTSVARSGRANGVYSYRVRACNGGVCSDYRVGSNSTQVDTTPPSAPTQLSAIVNSGSSVYLQWSGDSTDTGPSGWGGYRIYRDGVPVGVVTSPATRAYSDSGVPANVTHYYVVVSYDNLGNESANSNTVSIYIDTIPPTAPTNLQATAVTINQVSLTWGAASDTYGTVSYSVSRTPGSLSLVGAATSFTDNTVASNTSYTYQVTATDSGGNSASPISITVTTPAGAPSVPTMNGGFTQSTTGSFTISWSASSGPVSYYLLDQGLNNGGNFSSGYSTFTINAPAVTQAFSNKSSGDYYHRVKACSASGVCSGYSAVRHIQVCRSGCN